MEIAVESLRELGYATIVAATAAEARSWLEGPDRIDALFSDVVMPGGTSGVELAREAKRLRPGLKVLLTSGYAGDLNAGGAIDLPLLTKPYDVVQLAQSLRAVFAEAAM